MSAKDRADAVYETLLSRAGERWVQPRRERTARILAFLDDPQRTYRVVHITGTNGKTSTARMIESLLRAHDLRTGLFTSPHLERFTERIMIDGEPIADVAGETLAVEHSLHREDRPVAGAEFIADIAKGTYANRAAFTIAVTRIGAGA